MEEKILAILNGINAILTTVNPLISVAEATAIGIAALLPKGGEQIGTLQAELERLRAAKANVADATAEFHKLFDQVQPQS